MVFHTLTIESCPLQSPDMLLKTQQSPGRTHAHLLHTRQIENRAFQLLIPSVTWVLEMPISPPSNTMKTLRPANVFIFYFIPRFTFASILYLLAVVVFCTT